METLIATQSKMGYRIYSQEFHYCILGLKIFIYEDYRSTKVNIFKLQLDNSLNMLLFDDYGY